MYPQNKILTSVTLKPLFKYYTPRAKPIFFQSRIEGLHLTPPSPLVTPLILKTACKMI